MQQRLFRQDGYSSGGSSPLAPQSNNYAITYISMRRHWQTLSSGKPSSQLGAGVTFSSIPTPPMQLISSCAQTFLGSLDVMHTSKRSGFTTAGNPTNSYPNLLQNNGKNSLPSWQHPTHGSTDSPHSKSASSAIISPLYMHEGEKSSHQPRIMKLLHLPFLIAAWGKLTVTLKHLPGAKIVIAENTLCSSPLSHGCSQPHTDPWLSEHH